MEPTAKLSEYRAPLSADAAAGSGPILGEVCGQCQAPATRECQQCEEAFCTPCAERIHSRGRLAQHAVRPLPGTSTPTTVCDRVAALERVPSDVGSSGTRGLGALARMERSPVSGSGGVMPLLAGGARPLYCREHPEEQAQFFCLECECECICAECVVEGVHKGHRVVNVRKASAQLTDAFGQALAEAEARLEDRARAAQREQALRRDVEAVVSRGRRTLQETFEQLQVSLSRREAELLASAEQQERRACELLRTRAAPAQARSRELKEAEAPLRSLERLRGGEVELVRSLNAFAASQGKVSQLLGPTEGLEGGALTHLLDSLKRQISDEVCQHTASVEALASHVEGLSRTAPGRFGE